MQPQQRCHPDGLKPADGVGRRLTVQALPGYGIDDVLALDFFRPPSSKTKLEAGDRIEVRAHDMVWLVEIYVLGARLQIGEVAQLNYMITSLTITDAVSSFRRLNVADHHGPSLERCVEILAQLQRARDAHLLPMLQYQAAANQLYELVEDPAQLRELAEAPASNAAPEKSKKAAKPTLVTPTPPATA